MFTSRVTTVSLLALTMSVYVCLLATANARALAQKSAAVVMVQAQNKKGAQPQPGLAASAQVESSVEQVIHQSIRLSFQNEKLIARCPLSRETYCALLSKYLSLS